MRKRFGTLLTIAYYADRIGGESGSRARTWSGSCRIGSYACAFVRGKSFLRLVTIRRPFPGFLKCFKKKSLEKKIRKKKYKTKFYGRIIKAQHSLSTNKTLNRILSHVETVVVFIWHCSRKVFVYTAACLFYLLRYFV